MQSNYVDFNDIVFQANAINFAVCSSVKLCTSLQRILLIKMFKYSLIIQVVYEDLTMVHLSSPYVPEYLAFREVEFLVNCVSRLLKSKPELVPQVILVDGNGMLHPRGLIIIS